MSDADNSNESNKVVDKGKIDDVKIDDVKIDENKPQENKLPKNEEIYIDEDTLFIVENGGNTCYIDSLLMAMFYSESFIDAILAKKPKKDSYIYLQEFIKSYFVDHVRSAKSVTMDTINNMRFILLNCGWLSEDNLFSQQDVNEFFCFLADIFDITIIELQKQTFTDIHGSNDPIIEKVPFIPLSLPFNEELQTCPKEQITVKEMLYTWLYKNEVNVKRDYTMNSEKKHKNVTGLSVYHIHNIPEFVALSINRFPKPDKRLNTDIIIQKKLKPFKHTTNLDIRNIEWCFHAAICHRGETLRSGHYYSLLFKKKKDDKGDERDVWYIFDDLQQPCLTEISMNDEKITSKIKKECVFLLYQLKLL